MLSTAGRGRENVEGRAGHRKQAGEEAQHNKTPAVVETHDEAVVVVAVDDDTPGMLDVVRRHAGGETRMVAVVVVPPHTAVADHVEPTSEAWYHTDRPLGSVRSHEQQEEWRT